MNGLVVLTFGAERSTLPDDNALFDFIRARAIMFEQNVMMKEDPELDHLAALCIRISARHQLTVHNLIWRFNSGALYRLVTDRWNPKEISKWNRCSSSPAPSDFYWAECIALDNTCSVVHIDVVEGTFLVDGEPLGRLPERILTHKMLQRVFPDASALAVFHRGGGVFETNRPIQNGSNFTFALNDSELIVREIDGQGVARRLLPWQSFHDDLPQSLVEKYIHWMIYRTSGNCAIELRDLKDRHKSLPVYVIELDAELQGQVLHCETSLKMLNFAGEVFDHIYRTVGWRLDQKRYIEPYWPTSTIREESPDNWSVSLFYPCLHLHMEIRVVSNKISVTVLEYENMVVSSNQYLGRFIGLVQMLVLERTNGLRTVIIPNFAFQALKHKSHHRLEIINNYQHPELHYQAPRLLDSKYTSFAFDEDRSLGQMRPNGEETYEKWLMCAYLHGATCSAMAEPLTGLTGLEMALTQLRRCRMNKPLSATSLCILRRIEELAVTRCVAYDTQIVNWPVVHSSYSSSDAYIPLVYLIRTKSTDLSELYGAHQQEQGKHYLDQLQLVKDAYSKYEFIYSPAAQLDCYEKRKLEIGLPEVPIISFKSNFLPKSSPIYKLIHSGVCKTALEREMFNENFSWVTFIEKFDCVSPVFALNMLHVGYWTDLCFHDGSMWLTLLVSAISYCHYNKGGERALCLKRFTKLLSFAAWKLNTGNGRSSTHITALRKLLKLAMASNTGTAQLPSTKHLPGVAVHQPGQRFLDEKSFDFSNVISAETFAKLAAFWSTEKNVRSKLNTVLWNAVKGVKVWTTEASKIVAIISRHSPVKNAFLTITNSLPVPLTDMEKSQMVQLAEDYYKVLYDRQRLYEFTSELD